MASREAADLEAQLTVTDTIIGSVVDVDGEKSKSMYDPDTVITLIPPALSDVSVDLSIYGYGRSHRRHNCFLCRRGHSIW